MVKRPLEEANGQNLESICRAVKRLHTSSDPFSEGSGGGAQDQLAGTHPAVPQQPVFVDSRPLSPHGQTPSWLGAESAGQAAALHSGWHAAWFDEAAAEAAGAAASDPVLQRQQQALEQQLQQQRLVHEQQYLAREQQQQQLLEAQQQQQQTQQQHQQQSAAEQPPQQQFGRAEFAGPSTPRQRAQEQTSAAVLAREHAAYEASNTLLKDLHFERLRRLTISDGEGNASGPRWRGW